MVSSRRGVVMLVCGVALAGAPLARAAAPGPGASGPVAPLGSCAGTVDDAAPAPVPPVGVAACPELRPGDDVYSTFGDASSDCVVGPMYVDRRGDRYFITGPDCVPPYNFEAAVTTWPVGKGPAALDGRSGQRIGEWAFRFAASSGGLSLVRLDRAVPANPQVCQYGGPTGLNTEVTTDPTRLVMVGNEGGFLTWDLAQFGEVAASVLRPGVAAEGLYDGDQILVAAENMVEFGMPVLTEDGRLIGISDYYGADQHGALGLGTGMVVVRPAKPMRVAAKTMRTTFTLLTAPLA